jgi:uncharacterized protein YlxW (UPF0749 family)
MPSLNLEEGQTIWSVVQSLMPAAFTIAMLGAIESLLSAMVADGVISDKHNSNTELIGQGIANVLCPFFGGIPATGAIARTMTNINNGGRTPVAGIVHALILLLVLGFLVVLCLLYAFLQQASLALEMRRAHKELEEARQLAQRAERSRFVELNNELQKVVKDLQEQSVTRHNAVLARLETLEERMRVNMHDTINSVSASVGEVEDRLSQLVRVQTNALKEQKQSADDKQ